MAKSRAFLLAAMMVLAACAGADRQRIPSFETTVGTLGEMEFRFRGDAAGTESARMHQLEEHLRSNRLCAQGYDIVARTVAADGRGVDYIGTCKPLQCW